MYVEIIGNTTNMIMHQRSPRSQETALGRPAGRRGSGSTSTSSSVRVAPASSQRIRENDYRTCVCLEADVYPDREDV